MKVCLPTTGVDGLNDMVARQFIADAGAHIMLCSVLGPKAVRMFEQFGIDVFIGASGTVQDAIAAWQSGLLEKATNENACKEHRHH